MFRLFRSLTTKSQKSLLFFVSLSLIAYPYLGLEHNLGLKIVQIKIKQKLKHGIKIVPSCFYLPMFAMN